MRVADVMTAGPVTVRASTTVGHALSELAGHRITMLPVVDDGGRLIGVVSEADLIVGRIAAEPVPSTERGGRSTVTAVQATDPVVALMSRPSVFVSPATELCEVGRVFERTGFKSLPVLDGDDRVVGVVSRSDVVRALARDDETLAQDIADTLAAHGIGAYRATVRNGVVQLTVPPGQAASDALWVVDIVAATPGVTAVHAA